MNANNMSDEELDDLFRKSAEQHEPPFDPEAWAAMDQKLGKVRGPYAGLKRYLPILLLALLVSTVLIWENAAEHPSVPTKQSLSGSRKGTVSRPDSKAQTKEIENAAVPEPIASASPQRPKAQAGSGMVPHVSKHTLPNGNGSKKSITILEEGYLLSVSSKIQQTHPFAVLSDSTAGLHAFYRVQLPGTQESDTTSLEAPKTVAAIQPADSSRQKEKQERVFLKSVSVALLVAPDLTTVRFKDPESVSANAGLLVSLPLTKRLSLVSGAVWANKLYSATPQDYEPYPDFWNGKTLPDEITAKCKVLDIPLNLKYDVWASGANVLSVQAGLSSYIMLNEKYTYTYNHYGSNPYSKTREVDNENRHWFGVQNLSVGYTRKLSPVISVGAEPFVKLPLSSIGAGHVKLTSAGVFFTAGFILQTKN